jgi:hypothetical protein
MQAVQAVGTVVAVIAASAGRHNQPSAVLAGEALVAGVGFVVALLVLLALIFTVHNGIPLLQSISQTIIMTNGILSITMQRLLIEKYIAFSWKSDIFRRNHD